MTDEQGGRRADHGDAELGAWERTLEEMTALAAERADEGWDTLTVTAADTAPTPPDAGETDRFGLVYTVGGDVASDVAAAHDAGFDRYEVYRRQVGGTLFLVTELRNTGERRAVFVAGAVDLTVADRLVEAARERGELYTHLQTLDWTHLGSVHHDDPGAFFPSLA